MELSSRRRRGAKLPRTLLRLTPTRRVTRWVKLLPQPVRDSIGPTGNY